MKEIHVAVTEEMIPRQPLDRRLLGGIALTPYYDQEEIEIVKKRTVQCFQEARDDRSREYGACIAYATLLCEEEEIELDKGIYETASQQNHGMITTPEDRRTSSEMALWEGTITGTDRQFWIAKNKIFIPFTTGQFEEGYAWMLSAGRFNESNA